MDTLHRCRNVRKTVRTEVATCPDILQDISFSESNSPASLDVATVEMPTVLIFWCDNGKILVLDLQQNSGKTAENVLKLILLLIKNAAD